MRKEMGLVFLDSFVPCLFVKRFLIVEVILIELKKYYWTQLHLLKGLKYDKAK